MILAGGSTKSYALPSEGDVIIGRADECAVRIDHDTVSRQHAVLHVGGHMTLVDRDSANGTFVGGVRLRPGEPVSVTPGLVMAFGAVNAVVQSAPPSTRLRPVRSHDYFEARLEDECARASASAGAFALARVVVSPEDDLKFEAILSRALRAMDVVAVYAPHEYELLLFDLDADGAGAMKAVFEREIAMSGIDATMTVAVFPRDARTPEGLAALVRATASRESSFPPPPIVPSASVLERMRPLVERVAASDISVLIMGETGVGKELLSRMVHDLSARRDGPFLSINCAALQETLLESELFGHERGAFTGAVQTKRGLLESAAGGTVVLDEIGEMPLGVQAKLLRVFEHRKVTRVGSLKPTPIDVRFVAATNRDLEAEIERGTFRQDLYFRLSGMTLVLPPLRQRLGELEHLATGIIAQACTQMGRARPPRIASDAMALLKRHAWPGNVRELRNVLERAVLLCGGDVITLAHLPVDRMGRVLPMATRAVGASAAPPARETLVPMPPIRPASVWPREIHEEDAREGTRLARGFTASPEEKRKIEEALARCGGNQSLAAKMLGVSRRTLVTRIEQYGLPRPRKGASPED